MCIAIIVVINYQPVSSMENNVLVSANAHDVRTIVVKLTLPSELLQQDCIEILPDLEILSINGSDHTVTLTTSDIDLSKNYQVKYKQQEIQLYVDPALDNVCSSKQLGCEWDEQFTYFRIFAPRAIRKIASPDLNANVAPGLTVIVGPFAGTLKPVVVSPSSPI